MMKVAEQEKRRMKNEYCKDVEKRWGYEGMEVGGHLWALNKGKHNTDSNLLVQLWLPFYNKDAPICK